jgi:COMPASS component SWD3
MTSNRPHWLELAEYAALGLTLLTLLASVATGTWFLPLFLLTLTLGLNLINRLRWQAINRKRLMGMVRQFQSQWEEDKEGLTERIEALSPAGAVDNARSIATLQDNIIALEQSLNGIIEYLNHHALRERVEHLEKAYGHLRRELYQLTKTPETDISPSPESIEPKITLPALNLSAASSPADLPQWHCIRRLEAHGESVAAIALTGDERFLISAGWDRNLKVWDWMTGNLVTSVEAHDQGILALAVMGEGTYSVATGGFDQTVKLWDLPSSAVSWQLHQLFIGHLGSIHALGFAPRSRLLVSGSYDQTLKQWSLDREGEPVSAHDALGAIYALAIAPDEAFIASGGGDGTIALWQCGSGEKLAVLGGNVSSVKTLAISIDGRTIGAGCVDGTVKLWTYPLGEERTLQPIRVMNAHRGQVTALVFGSGGQWLFTGGTDGLIKVWNPNYQEAIVTLSLSGGRSSAVSCLVASADGRYLLAGCGDGTIAIWQKRE